jgi:hypothetical protein
VTILSFGRTREDGHHKSLSVVMMKTCILLLVAALASSFFQANAEPECPVSEMETKDFGFGQCQSRGQLDVNKCQQHCQKYADNTNKEVIASECSMSDEHADCAPVCICKLKCHTAGSGGDPHYFSWDIPDPRFDYMGLQKHYLIKPCQKYTTLPNFEIRQTNRPYSGAISVADLVELVIPEWERVIEVKIPMAPNGAFVLTVNGNKREIPYQYPSADSDTCSSNFVKVYFKDAARTQVLIETSFGVRITIMYAHVVVDVPRHPELKAKACGILGTPNGNKADDCQLSTGKNCTHEPGFDPQGVKNRPFGDSWIVPGNGVWSADCFPPEEQKKIDDFINNIPPETKKRIEQLCKDNAGNPAVVNCAKKLGQSPRPVEECIFDAQFLKTEKEQKEFIKTIVQAAAVSCDIDIPFIEGPPAKGCCMKNLTPLFRQYSNADDHFYTVNLPEAVAASTTNPRKYVFEGSPGFVAVTPDDCSCGANPTALKPVYRLFKGTANRDDHFYTMCPIETARFEKEKGYTREGIAFYCVEKTEGLCGATLPLWRVHRTQAATNGGFDHFYTTNEAEAKAQIAQGAVDEDMLCYIWPSPPAVTQK